MPRSFLSQSARRMGALLLFVTVAGVLPLPRVWAQTLAPPIAGDPFVRYTLPEDCAMHAIRLERQLTREQAPDTTVRAPWGRPLRQSTVEAVRRCVARFSMTTVPLNELLFLGKAYLMADQDALADSTFRRLISLSAKRPVEDRGWDLLQIVAVHLQSAPMRLAGAERYLAELDKLGAGAASSRMLAHTAIAEAAALADSVPLLGVHAKAAKTAAAQMVGDERRQRAGDEVAARKLMAYWYARRAVYDSARMEAARMQTDLADRRQSTSRLDRISEYYDWLGTKALPLERTWTYNNPDSATFPVAGKPTLIVFARAGCAECVYGYATVRRLAQKYTGAGLRIVFVARTWGYLGSRLMPAKDEAEQDQRYILDTLKLPVTLDMLDAPYTKRDDGKRINQTPPGFASYYKADRLGENDYPLSVLVDRNGIVRMAGPLTLNTERRYDNLLAEMQ